VVRQALQGTLTGREIIAVSLAELLSEQGKLSTKHSLCSLEKMLSSMETSVKMPLVQKVSCAPEGTTPTKPQTSKEPVPGHLQRPTHFFPEKCKG